MTRQTERMAAFLGHFSACGGFRIKLRKAFFFFEKSSKKPLPRSTWQRFAVYFRVVLPALFALDVTVTRQLFSRFQIATLIAAVLSQTIFAQEVKFQGNDCASFSIEKQLSPCVCGFRPVPGKVPPDPEWRAGRPDGCAPCRGRRGRPDR